MAMPNIGRIHPERSPPCDVADGANEDWARTAAEKAEGPPLSARARVLVVADGAGIHEQLVAGLAARGYRVELCGDAFEALRVIGRGVHDVVVTDLGGAGMSGIQLCERVAVEHRRVPVIVMTARGSFADAIAAIRAGARDFISKPFTLDLLALTVDRAVLSRALGDEVERLRRVVAESARFDDVLGGSPVMRALLDLLGRVSESESSVLITGETGTGKELVARAIHRNGRRAAGPFVAINCAAMPATLLEAELFGHAKGAFTDAREARVGLFQQAHGGTLFLDEIGDLALSLQPKLLRAIQERVVRPVGAGAEVPVDVRLVTATNIDVEDAVVQRRFREDLYYRVNVIQVDLPPLRARGSDVLLLAHEFLGRFAALAGKHVVSLSSEAAAKLLAYPWPGNVRELRNCIERAVALSAHEQLSTDDLPARIAEHRCELEPVAANGQAQLVTLGEIERRHVLGVLRAVGDKRSVAAQVLGLDRKTLYRMLKRYELPGKTQ